LLAVMNEAADAFMLYSPDKMDRLIHRWFGHKLDFGHV
jgi:hypothetical protein